MNLAIHEIDKKLDASWEYRHSDPIAELEIAKEAQLESHEIDYVEGIAATSVLQGDALARMSKFPEAIDYLDKAMSHLASVPYSKWHILMHFAYGHVYRNLGVYEQALEQYHAALSIAKEIDHEAHIANAEGNISMIYGHFGEYEKAIQSSLPILATAKEAGNLRTQFTANLNLAYAYHYTAEYEKAVEAAQEALLIATSNQEFLAAHGNLGVAYTDIGQYEQAKHHLENALSIAQEMDAEQLQCVCIVDLADYHIKVGEDDKAIDLLQKGLKLAQVLDFKNIIKDCHQRLHVIYRKQANWAQALHHHEQLYDVDKAMFNESSDKRIRNLEILHKVEKLRETNKQQQREYDALIQMKDTLLSNVSHDLKSPLATIKTQLYLARRAATSGEQRDNSTLRFLDSIETQVGRMNQLIEDILDLALIDTSLELHLQGVNFSDLVVEICMRFREQSELKGIALTCKCADEIYILVDLDAMRRALENLVSNAIKYTPSGGYVEIETTRLDNGQVMICIADNGVGIPENELPRIFERFYRVSTHQAMAEGTGLGLAIAQSIIEKHNGRIEVKSHIKEGTTFTILLPGVESNS